MGLFSTTVISEPDDVSVCEGKEAVFTCVLNTTDSSMSSNDVQWYGYIKDKSTVEVVDGHGTNVHHVTYLIIQGNTLTSQLNVTSARKSYTGYYWIRTPSFDVCNVSLTVLASMYVHT